VRWRTNNRFAAPIVVRMPGGFGKDVGDPWHSLSDEVRFAHALGWQVAMPSNAADAVGLLRAAMRSPNPTIFFEHRALLMTSDGSARYPGDDYVLPFGRGGGAARGRRVTLVTWGALVHRCREAAEPSATATTRSSCSTCAPWRRGTASSCSLGAKTGRCLVVHEDTLHGRLRRRDRRGARAEAFWWLDAPVERYCVDDVPMPYHPTLLEAVLLVARCCRERPGARGRPRGGAGDRARVETHPRHPPRRHRDRLLAVAVRERTESARRRGRDPAARTGPRTTGSPAAASGTRVGGSATPCSRRPARAATPNGRLGESAQRGNQDRGERALTARRRNGGRSGRRHAVGSLCADPPGTA
jgi:hypothetical protein